MPDRSRKLGQIVMEMNRTQQRVTLRINQALASMELNFTRLTILARFSSQPNRAQTITSLVAATGMIQPNVTKVTTCLVDAGLISVEPDPADARAKLLKITPAGMGEVIKAYGLVTPILAEAFKAIDDDQLEQLLQLISELNIARQD